MSPSAERPTPCYSRLLVHPVLRVCKAYVLLCTWPYHRDPLPTEDAVLTHVTSKLGTVQRALPVLPKHLLEVRVLKKGSGVAAIRGVRPSGPCENSPPCAMVGRAMRYRSYCPRIDLTFLIAFRGRSSLGVGMGCIDSRRCANFSVTFWSVLSRLRFAGDGKRG